MRWPWNRRFRRAHWLVSTGRMRQEPTIGSFGRTVTFGEVDLFSCRTSHSVSLLGMSALRLFTLVLRKDKVGFLQYDGYE